MRLWGYRLLLSGLVEMFSNTEFSKSWDIEAGDIDTVELNEEDV